MAKYPNITLTNAGLSMIAESQGSGQLIFTNIKLGDGSLAAGENIKALTAVKNPLLTANISNIDTKTAGQTTLTAVISNAAVTSGFFAREMGVYAKVGTDGAENLYAYTNAGNYADYMPDKTAQINENQIKITLIVGNAANVTAIIDGSIVYPTKEVMTESIAAAVATHDEKAATHAPAFAAHNAAVDSHTPAFAAHNADQNAHGIFLKKSGGTMTGPLTASAGVDGTRISASDWFRSKEDTGWLSEKHGGGWYMIDSDWIRALNGKGIFTTGTIMCDGGFRGKLDGCAATIGRNGDNTTPMTFNWTGQAGQPLWLWGSNDGLNIYAYNPSNFDVAKVGGYTAAQLLAASQKTSASLGGNGWWRDEKTGMMIQWGTTNEIAFPAAPNASSAQNTAFPVAFPSACLNVSLTIVNHPGEYDENITALLYAKGASSFTWIPNDVYGVNGMLASVSWMAIGY